MTANKLIFSAVFLLAAVALLFDFHILGWMAIVGGMVIAFLRGNRVSRPQERFEPELGMYDPATGEYISGSRPLGSFSRYIDEP